MNNRITIPQPTYHVIDRHTGKVVAKGLTQKGARRKVDCLDNAYGGCRYTAHRSTLGAQ